jgi:hypothetical protein
MRPAVGLAIADVASRVGLGIEVENDGRSAEVRELDLAPVLVGESEVGCLVAGFDHRFGS